MKRLLWLLTGVGLLLVGYQLGRWRSRPLPRTVATVNGKTLTDRDLELALEAYGDAALTELIRQQLIEEAAAQQGIRVGDDELPQKRAERTRLLERKLILAQVSESEQRRIHKEFRTELAAYDVACAVFPSAEEAETAVAALSDGEPFKTLTGSHAQFKKVTVPFLKERFGSLGGEAVSRLKPGEFSQPVPTPYGPTVFQVDRRVDSFEAVRTGLEDLLVNAHKDRLLAELVRKSEVAIYHPTNRPVQPLISNPNLPGAATLPTPE